MHSQERHIPCQHIARRARLAGRIVGLVSVVALAGPLSNAYAQNGGSGGSGNSGGGANSSSVTVAPTTAALAVAPLSSAGGVLNFSSFQSTNTFIPHNFPQGGVVGDGADIRVSLIEGQAKNQVTLRFEEIATNSPLQPDYLRNLTFQAATSKNFLITGVSLTAIGFTASGDYSGFASVDTIGKNGVQTIATPWASMGVNAIQTSNISIPGLTAGVTPSLFDLEWYLVNAHQNQTGSGTFTSLDATFTVSSVPEPTTNAMMALGLLVLGGLSLQKRRS